MSVSYFHIATTTFAILCFVIIEIYNIRRKQKMPLYELISLSLTASTIPTGILLVLCAFDTRLILEFQGIGVFLAIAGLTFLYTIINKIKVGLRVNKDSNFQDIKEKEAERIEKKE